MKQKLRKLLSILLILALVLPFVNTGARAAAETSVLEEGFEDGGIPNGWTLEDGTDGVNTYTWNVKTGDSSESTGAHSGTYNATAKYAKRGLEAWLITPEMDLSGAGDFTRLSFWYINRKWGSDIDKLGVYYRVNAGSWVELFYTEEAHEAWTQVVLTLPAAANAANVQIGFKAIDGYGYYASLDDIELVKVTGAVSHTVTYDTNGGTGEMAASSAYDGLPVILSENGFTAPETGRFLKWNTQADGSGTDYAPGDSVTMTGDLILYAIWEYPVTVTYDVNGGSGDPAAVNVYLTDTYTVANNTFTAPEGMRFQKWNTAADGTGIDYYPGASVTLTGNVTLYAQWVDANSLDGGFESGEIPGNWSQESTVTGYEWTVGVGDKNESTGAYEGNKNAKIVHKSTGATAWLITPAMDFTAGDNKLLRLSFAYVNRIWINDFDKLTVAYRIGTTGDWQTLFETTEKHDEWTVITLRLPDAAKTANVQIGFQATDGFGYGIGLDDVQLMLVDTEVQYAISYNANGGTGTMTDSTGYEGFQVNVSENGFNPPEGMRFQKWNTAADGTGIDYYPGASVTLTGNVTLYAQWVDANSLDGGFESGEIPGDWSQESTVTDYEWTVGVGDKDVSTGAYEGSKNAKIVHKSTGATAWLITPAMDFTAGADKMLQLSFALINRNDGTRYIDQLRVYYRIGTGGKWQMVYETTEEHAEWAKITLLLPDAAKTANVQIGFQATDKYGKGIGLDAVMTELADAIDRYAISYNANGGTGTMTDSTGYGGYLVNAAENGFTAPNDTSHFWKWNTEADGSGTDYYPGDPITMIDNLTLYAIWESPVTITYDANGGTGEAVEGIAYPSESYTVADNTFDAPEGKRFWKWNTIADGTGTDYYQGASITITSDLTLYAIWESPVTVTYDANGGTGEAVEKIAYPSESHTVANSTFTAPEGMRFQKWNTAADGTGIDYYPGASVTLTGNVTLYAQWVDATSLIESFESGAIPDDWSQDSSVTGYEWTVGVGDYSSSHGTHSGSYNAKVNGSFSSNGTNTWLITPTMDFSSVGADKMIRLSFWYLNSAYNGSKIDPYGVSYRVNGGEWQTLFYTEEAHDTWTEQMLALPPEAKAANVEIGFRVVANYGNGGGLDDVELTLADPGVQYAISYDKNGGGGTMADSTAYEGFAATVSANGFNPPEGMRFQKWNTAADGTGIDYYPGASVTLTGNVTLYAQWVDANSLDGGFESGEIPGNWSQESTVTGYEWTVGVGDKDVSTGAYEGSKNAKIVHKSTGATAWLITPAMDFTAGNDKMLQLSFAFINRNEGGARYIDQLRVYYRIGTGGKWQMVYETTEEHAEWTEITLLLPDAAKTENVQIGFQATDKWGKGIGLDAVKMELADAIDRYAISYNANGGTGTMTDSTGYGGYLVNAAENGFTAPDDTSHFWKWNTEADGSGTDYYPGDPICMTSDFTLYAQWVQDPKFKTQSLVLSGKLGVNFFMDLSSLSDDDKANSYMEFTVSGETTTADFDESFTDTNTGDYYGFTCYVTSIQMADTIQAVFHYGENSTVTKNYSVKKYLQTLDENSASFDAKTIALAHAIADYGHYAQIFLSEVNNIPEGKYADMDTFYAQSYNMDEVKTAVSGYTLNLNKGASEVGEALMRLSLDSETALSVRLTVTDNTELTATATLNEKTFTAEKQKDGSYIIKIVGIKASQLGSTITINGTAGDDFSVTVSALAYVNSILNSSTYSNNTDAKNAVASLYYYYLRSIEFKNDPQNGK